MLTALLLTGVSSLLLIVFFCFQIAFIFTIVTYTLPVYDGYVYPAYANFIGFLISVIPLLPIPFFMIKELFFKQQGPFIQVSLASWLLLS
jgi:hypothetical protein